MSETRAQFVARLEGRDHPTRGESNRRKLDRLAGQIACEAGWHVDRDNFWTRRRNKGEPDITDCRIGLSTQRNHFTRTVFRALEYDDDHGERTPHD